MSDTDSFIDEVTEEVRRDRLFKAIKRYGWIGVLAVLAIVGGAAWNEWNKAKERDAAERFGDGILSALRGTDGAMRAADLSEIEVPGPASAAVIELLAASEEVSEAPEAAAQRLLAFADQSGVDPIYQQIAVLKAVSMPKSGLSESERRTRLEGLALNGGLIRLLAEEQLALISVETGDLDTAMAQLQQLVEDAEATPGLRQRARRVIVALGGDPLEVAVEE